MKKLSLILALVLVLTCGVLAACDDTAETSSTADVESSEVKTESSATEDSSEAAAESSEAAESGEPAESSEVTEDSSVVIELGEVVSTGKSYTATAPNRGDGDSFNDDGKRLTDGTKGQEDGGTSGYAGWNSLDKTVANVVEIVVDLGEAMDTAAYRVYLAGGNWGIGVPTEFDSTSIEIFAADSADGEFVSVASALATDIVLVTGTGVADESWSTFTLTAGAAETVNARFIKFVITVAPVGNGFIWLDEVEACAPVA